MVKVFSAQSARFLISAVLLGGAVLAAGCAYQPSDTVKESPITRKFTWLSYLDGADIRNACTWTSPLQLRAIYNGVYDEQVRTYDVKPRDGEKAAFDLSVRVFGEANLAELKVGEASDLLDPWRGAGVKTILRQKDVDLLVKALKSDGAMTNASKGLELHSDDFYWIVVGCVEGQALFHGFKWPQAPFLNAQFRALLLGWDMTGIPINSPRKVLDSVDPTRRPVETRADFQVRIGEKGLWGLMR